MAKSIGLAEANTAARVSMLLEDDTYAGRFVTSLDPGHTTAMERR